MKIALPCLLSIFLITSLAYAHPPQDIEVSYNKGDDILKVVVSHHVSNPQKHFIENIKITRDENIILDKDFAYQTDNNTQSIDIKPLGLKAGDKITIEAECIIYGKLKKLIQI